MVSRFYLDTSVAYHALVGTPGAVAWFDSVGVQSEDVLVSSRLLRTELTRALRREGVAVSDRDRVLDKVAMVPVTEAVLTSAEAITEHVKTLDAIHLASALAVGADVVMVSHDDGLKRVAEVLGLEVLDPLAAESGGG